MSPLVSPTSTDHSFRDIWVKFCRHITLGYTVSFCQKVGVGPPWGIFSTVFFEISTWKFARVMPLPRKTHIQNNAWRGTPWAPGLSLEGASRKAPFSSTCLEEMRISSSWQLWLAHGNSLAQGDLTSGNFAPHWRLMYFLVACSFFTVAVLDFR